MNTRAEIMHPLVYRAMELAISQVGVRERGRNRGAEVDAYILASGLDPTKGSFPWCVAFLQYCFRQAAAEMNLVCPLPRTASGAKLWAKSPQWMRTREPKTGAIFLMDKGQGKSHAGMVVDQDYPKWRIHTVEGNTNDEGSREGDGVYRRSRAIDEINLGFIDVGAKPPEPVA